MYFGSVKFFRHLIIGTFLLLLTVAIVLSIVFGVKYFSLKGRSEEAATQVSLEAVATSSNASEVSSTASETEAKAPSYTKLYPDMYCSKSQKQSNLGKKNVYLTFDDGPSDLTPSILDTLKRHDAKATFFVVGTQIGDHRVDILQRIIDEGHAVGIHTYSHDYNKIYSSVEEYLKDFYKAYNLVKLQTGHRATIFRFPGGSINAYNSVIYDQIIAEMTRRGFVYFDWDVSSGDAGYSPTVTSVKNNILNAMKKKTNGIVLMHDTKQATASALDEVLKNLKKMKFSFKALNPDIKPLIFGY